MLTQPPPLPRLPFPYTWVRSVTHGLIRAPGAEDPGDSGKPKTIPCFQATLLLCPVRKLINYLESNISLFASEKGSASLIEPGFET